MIGSKTFYSAAFLTFVTLGLWRFATFPYKALLIYTLGTGASAVWMVWIWHGLGFGRRIEMSHPKWNHGGYAVVVSILIFIGIFCSLSVLRVNALSPLMWDLGNFDQPLWNWANGYGLELTQVAFDGNETRFTSHVEPILFLWGVAYWITPSVFWLLLSQVVFVGSTSWVLFIIFRKSHDTRLAFFLALAFLLFPATHFNTLNDFHTDSPAMFFLALAFFAMIEERWKLYCFTLILALACKEYAALVIFCLGAYALLIRKRVFVGVVTMAVAATWFYIAMQVIMPHFNGGKPSATLVLNYANLGAEHGLKGMLLFALEHPFQLVQKLLNAHQVENIFFLMVPLLFLPILGLPELAIATPIFLKDLLVDFNIGTHHLGMALPFLFIALDRALKRESVSMVIPNNFIPAALLGGLFFSVLLISPSPLGQRFWRDLETYFESPGDIEAKAMMRSIPSNASVATTPQLAPYLTHRRYCYLFPRPLQRERVDYVALDLDRAYRDMYWCPFSEVLDSLNALQKDARFELIEQSGDRWLFKRRDFQAIEPDAPLGHSDKLARTIRAW